MEKYKHLSIRIDVEDAAKKQVFGARDCRVAGERVRYIPQKDAFLKFESQYCESETQSACRDKFRTFLRTE